MRASTWGGASCWPRFLRAVGGLAGLVEVLGSQHRLMDGISGGVGFVGIVVALLARLNPVAVIPTGALVWRHVRGRGRHAAACEHSVLDYIHPAKPGGAAGAGV